MSKKNFNLYLFKNSKIVSIPVFSIEVAWKVKYIFTDYQ